MNFKFPFGGKTSPQPAPKGPAKGGGQPQQSQSQSSSAPAAAPAPQAKAPSKPARKVLVAEGIDLLQILIAVVDVVLAILTILKILNPIVFWVAYSIGLTLCQVMYPFEKRSTVVEAVMYGIGVVPIVLFILSLAPAFAALGSTAVILALVEMALIALYQTVIAKWLE